MFGFPATRGCYKNMGNSYQAVTTGLYPRGVESSYRLAPKTSLI